MNDKKTEFIRKVIGCNLRTLRVTAGKTQNDIGGFLGVTFQQIQKYEKGVNRISAEDIYQLAEFLNVSINDFFDYADNSDSE